MLEALRGVKRGRVLDLSQPISKAAPRMGGMAPYSLIGKPAVDTPPGGIGWNGERVEMDLHTGTHVDALGHVVWRGESRSSSIEELPPLVTRGVLIDIVGLRGRPLEGGELVTPADLEAALQRQGIDLSPGCVVLIRTGWSRWYGTDNQKYVESEPGIGLAGARWLSGRRVAAVGSDTMGVDVLPLESEDVAWPVHGHLLAEAGVYIIENAMLEELAEAGSADFLCLLLAPPFVGGTAAPLRLAAVI